LKWPLNVDEKDDNSSGDGVYDLENSSWLLLIYSYQFRFDFLKPMAGYFSKCCALVIQPVKKILWAAKGF